MFKLSEEQPGVNTLTIIYHCTPLQKDEALVTLSIDIPGCGENLVNWVKVCGTDWKAHPGLMVDLKEVGSTSQPDGIIKDGLNLYSMPKKGKRGIDRVIKEFKIHGDSFELFFYTKIDEINSRVFQAEAGPNNALYNKLIQEASEYQLGRPSLSYDQTVAGITLEGDLVNGGIVTKGPQRTLKVTINCLKKEELFFNVIFNLPGGKSVSTVFTKDCVQKITTTSIGSENRGIFMSILVFIFYSNRKISKLNLAIFSNWRWVYNSFLGFKMSIFIGCLAIFAFWNESQAIRVKTKKS